MARICTPAFRVSDVMVTLVSTATWRALGLGLTARARPKARPETRAANLLRAAEYLLEDWEELPNLACGCLTHEMIAAMDTAIAVGLITAGSTLAVGVTTGYISSESRTIK